MSLVRNFGAIGDGRTDDTQALQHAIDDGDGLIELSKGTYRISRPLVVDLARQGFRSIRGDDGTPRIVMTGPGPAIHILGDHQGTANPTLIKLQTWEKERMPVLSGIEILGEHEEADGIRLQKTLQCTVYAVLIRRCRYGIHLVERNRNFLLTHCHIYHNRRIGVFFDHVNLHQVNVIGNHISYNAEAGIKILGGEIRDFQITGNDIEYNHDINVSGSADICIDTSEENATMRELTITGNTIQADISPGGANIRIIGAPTDRADRSGLAAIAGNLIGSQAANVHLKNARGITVSGNCIYSGADFSIHAEHCRNIVVGANSIDHNPGPKDAQQLMDGIAFDGCQGCSISGVILEDCRRPDGAVILRSCIDTAVTGCQMLDPAKVGVSLSDCTRCRISDNAILDRRTPPRMETALRVVGNSTRNLIQNNMIQKGTVAAITAEPTTATQQANMIL